MPTWKPFYNEVARTLLTYEGKQDELLALLREMQQARLKTINLQDTTHSNSFALDVVDPFTFLAGFHHSNEDVEQWRRKLEYLHRAWHLSQPVPEEPIGFSLLDAARSWFFPYAATRQPDDVSSLWKLARVAVESPDSLDDTLLARCLRIQSLNVPKLTLGLFWLTGGAFLPLDSVVCKYLRRYGIEWDETALESGSVSAYRALMNEVSQQLTSNYAVIPTHAWRLHLDAARTRRFWVGHRGPFLERLLSEHTWRDNARRPFSRSMEWQSEEDQRTLDLIKEVRVGDAFAIKGASPVALVIYAEGTVSEVDYEKRIVKLDSFSTQMRHMPRRSKPETGDWRDSLLEVTRPEDIGLIFGDNALLQMPEESVQVLEKPEEVFVPLPSAPLNQIFYGPPGTGKTYSSIKRAVEVISGPDAERSHSKSKAEFDRLRREGRIGFVTFHQSFSYEEFVEGIRPALDGSTSSGASYVCRDGVLKEMALRALGAALRPVQVDKQERATFGSVWDALQKSIKNQKRQRYHGLASKSEYLLKVGSQGDILGYTSGDTHQSVRLHSRCTRVLAEWVWNAFPDKSQVSTIDVESVFSRVVHTQFIATIVNELKLMAEAVGVVPIADEVGRAHFFLSGSESFTLLPTSELPRYVLIVDEINRGNISKILGELITLLEEDKRLGAENALTVTLPYSGEAFALPPNLFLIGTMNTADKSLALLDVALRRRFEFEEMPPRFEVCRSLSPEMQQVLVELNRRLTLARDREHRIGHAYFVRVSTPEEFNHVFERKIVPLLQEFFFNDWDGLRAVLGESKFKSGRFIRALNGDDGSRARTRWQWWLDEARDKDAAPFSCFEALCLNYGINAGRANSEGPAAYGEASPQVLEDAEEEA